MSRNFRQVPDGDLGGPLPGFAGTRFAGHDNKGVNLQGRWYYIAVAERSR
jgi:hypothetical protein